MFIAYQLYAWETYIEEHFVSEKITGKVTEACGKNLRAILRRKSEQPHRREKAAKTRDRGRRKEGLKTLKMRFYE